MYFCYVFSHPLDSKTKLLLPTSSVMSKKLLQSLLLIYLFIILSPMLTIAMTTISDIDYVMRTGMSSDAQYTGIG